MSPALFNMVFTVLEGKQYGTLSTFQELLVQNNFICVVGKRLNTGYALSVVKARACACVCMHTLNKTSLKKKPKDFFQRFRLLLSHH